MASSGKFDGIPTGQRGSFMASALERSSSFHESRENSSSSALPSISRNGSAVSPVTHGEAMNFVQCLRFDPKLVAADLKVHRQAEFKRFINGALGNLPDDSVSGYTKGKLLPSPLPEELKRLKASLHESSIKARERGKLFHDVLSSFNKHFPSVPARMRSRSDAFCSQRPVLGPRAGKLGMQSHNITAVFENEQQKSEERTNSCVPNKRTRTSLVDLKADARFNALSSPSGAVDGDREIFRVESSGAVQTEDRPLTIGVDSWDKSNMKKKRSGIKPDVSPTVPSTKPAYGYQEPKQGIQQRLVTDTRSRLNNDSHEFKSGIANVSVGTGKTDGASQQPSLGTRSSLQKTEQDNNSVPTNRRDRPSCSDKERVNLRAVNKFDARGDANSARPISSTIVISSASLPRSNSGVVPKSSPAPYRPATLNDWDISHCSNKLPATVVANDGKRTPPVRSSSPPVTNWAGQRPHKISRSARRTNYVPIVPSKDDSSTIDTIFDAAGNENGSGLVTCMRSNYSQKIKIKGNPVTSAVLSESEDSAVVEIKSCEKSRKFEEMDEKSGPNVQKASTLLLSTRKKKFVSGNDLGDCVQKQGKIGRDFTPMRSPLPMTVEKLGGAGAAKQLRSAKRGVNKTERGGRPTTRKLSDRKAYTREKNTLLNAASSDYLVGPDDGHGELLAAVKAAIDTTHSFSSSFWRQMEAYSASISDIYIDYLRQQAYLESAAPNPLDIGTVPNGSWSIKCERDTYFTSEACNEDPEMLASETSGNNNITLCQRLFAALITEVDCEDICSSGNEDPGYGSELELGAELEAGNLNYRSSGNFQIDGYAALNGHRISASGRPLDKRGHVELENNIENLMNSGSITSFDCSKNIIHVGQEPVAGLACTEIQYDTMSLDNRILLEMQNVGVFLDVMPDMAFSEFEEITEDIHRLEVTHQCQASKKRSLLGEILKFAKAKRKLQERDLDQRAIDKLVEMTYGKYMTFWGPNASGGKSYSTKIAKKASLSFVKRTVDRCQKFEDSGKRCFSETVYRDMLLSVFTRPRELHSADTTTDGESYKLHPNNASALKPTVSASISSQQSPSLTSRFGQNMDIYSSDLPSPINYSTDQTSYRENSWSNQREVLLNDVGTINTSRVSSCIGNSIPSSTKGKRSDPDGKGQSREVLNTKFSRQSLSNAMGERKSKAKLKQKTTQLSASINGLLGKMSEQPNPVLPCVLRSSGMVTSRNAKGSDSFGLDTFDNSEASNLSHLQLSGMDVLGVPNDLDDQGEDLDSWLNIDDDVLQDDDFMGLEIPMDDLSDLNMMV